MESVNTLDEIKEVIHRTFGIDPATLVPDAPLSDYGLDSLALAELLFSVEDHFGVSVPQDRQDVNTLAGLSALIDQLRQSAAP